MKRSHYRPGQIVEVFEDWIACKKPEGRAKLVRLFSAKTIATEPPHEYWTVRFLGGSGEPEVNRRILLPPPAAIAKGGA